ncbi:hypothetical protein ACFXAF_34360 [Kitasatospora sp. NPDC059463]
MTSERGPPRPPAGAAPPLDNFRKADADFGRRLETAVRELRKQQ